MVQLEYPIQMEIAGPTAFCIPVYFNSRPRAGGDSKNA